VKSLLLFLQNHKKQFLLILSGSILFALGLIIATLFPITSETNLVSPFIEKNIVKKELPLLKYTIPNLKSRRYAPSTITLEKIISETTDYTNLLFSYISDGKKITGQLNLPKIASNNPTKPTPIILLIRGYVPQEIYKTGTGTKNAAKVFAENGYITIAPDFLGFGESDLEPENSWEARFIKPIQITELISSLRTQTTLEYTSLEKSLKATSNPEKLGIWAHSNGGQIALTTLEIMEQSIPTTLWAPVTVPFPYSVLFYTDEMDDEGRATRLWLAEFEKNYDPREFSLTQYLSSLSGPIQLHHGETDDAALITWSNEFVEKIEKINTAREDNDQEIIELTYYTYPNTNHNMVPSWNKAIQKDLSFFEKSFKDIEKKSSLLDL
jgi:dipeptidyl aminopeptidase/acylaminoacyl peptidase